MSGYGLSSRAIIGAFFDELALPTVPWIDAISMMFDSDQDSESYKWLGMAPAMREWIGGRQAKGFRENGLTITNKDFEATLEVLLKELRRDKTGQILIRVREMAQRANTHWASLLSTLLINGSAALCYDGQYFFDTDHSEGSSGTQDNDLSVDISALPAATHGVVTAPSVEEMQQCIQRGINAILGFKDDQGEPMNETASNFLIMVPTSLGIVTSNALKPLVVAGQNNLVMDGFNLKPVVNPRLTGTDNFMVFRTDGKVKPLIRQEEVPIEVSAIAEGSELEFKENKHHYGVNASRNVGYGYWQHACLVTMA